MLAQEIHARSPRNGKAYVAVNCAALPETLIESELFGYERGAFTGAAQQKKGKFEQANGGTLFLDEIGDMNPVTQSKVLRALENRTIERLGGSQSIPVDVRVISATHRNLQSGDSRREISRGFVLPFARGDNRVAVSARAQRRYRRAGGSLSSDSWRAARAKGAPDQGGFDYPGTVRLAGKCARVKERDGAQPGLMPQRRDRRWRFAGRSCSRFTRVAKERRWCGGLRSCSEKDFRDAKRKFEVAYLLRQLGAHRWNISRTAATIGLHRQSLQERLRELGIRRPGQEAPEDDE